MHPPKPLQLADENEGLVSKEVESSDRTLFLLVSHP
jgi:hypothetical protein